MDKEYSSTSLAEGCRRFLAGLRAHLSRNNAHPSEAEERSRPSDLSSVLALLAGFNTPLFPIDRTCRVCDPRVRKPEV